MRMAIRGISLNENPSAMVQDLPSDF
jgi:hypothetical protein